MHDAYMSHLRFTMNEISRKLEKLFKLHRVMDIVTIQKILGGRSKRTVFRDLNQLKYLTSYSHARKFYTLQEIPEFDSDGLWNHNDVYFSKCGTLKNTVAGMINSSEEGMTHRELETLLQVRLHNTLLDLIRSNIVERKKMGQYYVYFSADQDVNALQLERRGWTETSTAYNVSLPSLSVRINVLAEMLRSHTARTDYHLIKSRLIKRGVIVTVEQIERIVYHYEVKKN